MNVLLTPVEMEVNVQMDSTNMSASVCRVLMDPTVKLVSLTGVEQKSEMIINISKKYVCLFCRRVIW